jgi:hypothetical protein
MWSTVMNEYKGGDIAIIPGARLVIDFWSLTVPLRPIRTTLGCWRRSEFFGQKAA